MNKKIYWVIIFVLLLFAGIIAMTQESDIIPSTRNGETAQEAALQEAAAQEEEDAAEENTDEPALLNVQTMQPPVWVRPLRWYRSNQGGMALEEMPSQLTALRNEFALSVEFVQRNSLPENLLPYYNVSYFIENRILYENGQPVRFQWIFRNIRGLARVNAAFWEASDSISGNEPTDDDDNAEKKQKAGFIEIFNENSFLVSEYRYFEDGRINRTDYNYRDGLLISSMVFFWEEYEENEEEGSFKEDYADFLRYNRSLYLRSVERVFYRDIQIALADEPVRIAFPREIMDIDFLRNQIGERLNEYPGFFGDVLIERDSRMVYITDERSRIISQTLYDHEDNVLWNISNTWSNDRIVSTVKTEDGIEYIAEYEYNSAGEKIAERNFKNGILERIVRIEGKTEIEELILNDIVVMRAVWEDGRKVSETRTGSR